MVTAASRHRESNLTRETVMMRCPAETHSVDSSEADAQDRISERDAEGNGSEMEEDSLNPSLTEASYTTRSDLNASRGTSDDISSISFGALAKVQSTPGKRKRGSEQWGLIHHSPAQDAVPRQQTGGADAEALERKTGKKDVRNFVRVSKHAPAEVSSKKAVSRKRGVVSTPKHEIRDPRFESLSGPLNKERLKKKYAFLDTYRDNEIAELKAELRESKAPAAREALKRALTSMESKKKTQELKEQRQDVLRKHRKEEREKVEKGKRPFYLKRGEIMERTLKERFEHMKGKQIEKVVEKRRRKQTGKERRVMPVERRM